MDAAYLPTESQWPPCLSGHFHPQRNFMQTSQSLERLKLLGQGNKHQQAHKAGRQTFLLAFVESTVQTEVGIPSDVLTNSWQSQYASQKNMRNR